MAVRKTRTVDARARVTLPHGFARSTVILEQVSETEVRIRKTNELTEKHSEFAEEAVTTLSDRDCDRFLQLIDEPAAPNAALRKAMSQRREHHG